MLESEKISAYSHGLAIPVMALGTIFLLVISYGDTTAQFVSLLYGLSGIFLFSASFLYHSKKLIENGNSFWRKLDHVAIFFLIAGTYTPLCFLYLDGKMKWGILIAQWSLVLSGTIFKFFYINAPRFIGTLIYLTMGWLLLIPTTTLIQTMPPPAQLLLITGGGFYTVGAIIYMLKKPNPRPGSFGFHEIFHLFIFFGAIMHLCMIIYGMKTHSPHS